MTSASNRVDPRGRDSREPLGSKMSSNHKKMSSNSDPVRLLEPPDLMEPLEFRDGFLDPPASSWRRPPISRSASSSGPASTMGYMRPRASAPTSAPAGWASRSVLIVGALACFGAGIALSRLPSTALDHGPSSDRSHVSPPPAIARTAMEPAVEPPASTAGERKLTETNLAESNVTESNVREPRLLEPKQPESELPQPGSAGPCAADAGANERCLDGTKHVPRHITKLAPSPTPDAADGTASAPDRERHFAAGVDVSTCFPSASAVRQEHPEAWPSWTLRTPGHEGTRCWYAAPRATARPSR